MKKLIAVCFILMGVGGVEVKADDLLTEQSSYTPQSSGLPSVDFIKRFGKHCTTHKNMIGRQVFGLCDDKELCQNSAQYKACYKYCIQQRKKEDDKTKYIFGKLAECKISPNDPDQEKVAIFNQAKLRIQPENKKVISTKTFEMPVEQYQPERTKGIRSYAKSLNPFSTNCTTHKNKLGVTTSGVCDNGKQCQTANYKKCYNACVTGRPADDKTPYILKKLTECKVNFQDLELGKMAKDVNNQYFSYELKHGRTQLSKENSK